METKRERPPAAPPFPTSLVAGPSIGTIYCKNWYGADTVDISARVRSHLQAVEASETQSLAPTGHEIGIRLTVSAVVFVVLALAERGAPRRPGPSTRLIRWPTNLAMTAFGAVLIWVVLPLGPVAAGAIAQDRGWGVLGTMGLATTPLGVAGAVVALDFAIYGQHVLMHRVPVLWRLHRVHHADATLDASTGVRFHPLELLLSAALKVGLVLILGAPAVAVVAFEMLLNVSSLFSHANLRLSVTVDRVMRVVFVTPDMHRVHHSVDSAELNRNFGFALTWWDRLCGTYRPEPAAGHEAMGIGLESIPPARAQRLGTMLVEPFRID